MLNDCMEQKKFSERTKFKVTLIFTLKDFFLSSVVKEEFKWENQWNDFDNAF